MFGKKSLEEKLRHGNGKSAPATILETKEASGYNAGPTRARHSRQHYMLRVEPADESAFEAEVTVWGDDLPENPQAGRAVVVLRP